MKDEQKCEDEQMWISEVQMSRYEDEIVRRRAGMKMSACENDRCEHQKMQG